jgi:DNA replicative helicase MCM subunit Mcm2 (Cdc46/Mcm family)
MWLSDQLRANLLLKLYAIEVDLRHVNLFNPELAHAVQDRPADLLPLFETAAARAAKNILFPIQLNGARGDAGAGDVDQEIPSIQIMVKSGLNMLPFRDLTVRYIGPFTRYVQALTSCAPGRYSDKARSGTWHYHLNLSSPIAGDQAPLAMQGM